MVVLQVFTLVAVLRDGYVEISADGGAVWWSGKCNRTPAEGSAAGWLSSNNRLWMCCVVVLQEFPLMEVVYGGYEI